MNKKNKEVYQFDNVFGPEMSTKHIFDSHVKDIVHSAMGGINQTVFAYGQTSSGKTYTMRGSSDQDNGLIPLSVKELFGMIDQDTNRKY
jgi:centromeric protein E